MYSALRDARADQSLRLLAVGTGQTKESVMSSTRNSDTDHSGTGERAAADGDPRPVDDADIEPDRIVD
ncbi:hypothetical protein AYM40_07595 [Paraburkholderia phytofirmans OLGA172]|uniref:Uncharacterized protein n=1 Tax=Paraburkholderia phytofirmans OLGA172 TaxID=1417228 RepID=A0A160FJV5_9BURK|nr:hypothetical protein AYM40_07595 [Paraburkholderia phytofirmans OLGA172]